MGSTLLCLSTVTPRSIGQELRLILKCPDIEAQFELLGQTLEKWKDEKDKDFFAQSILLFVTLRWAYDLNQMSIILRFQSNKIFLINHQLCQKYTKAFLNWTLGEAPIRNKLN